MAKKNSDEFELPRKIEAYLASVSHRYSILNELALQKLVINAKPRFNVEVDYNISNGGVSYHDLYLQVPEVSAITQNQPRAITFPPFKTIHQGLKMSHGELMISPKIMSHGKPIDHGRYQSN